VGVTQAAVLTLILNWLASLDGNKSLGLL